MFVAPQNVAYCMQPIWRTEIQGGFYISGKFCASLVKSESKQAKVTL